MEKFTSRNIVFDSKMPLWATEKTLSELSDTLKDFVGNKTDKTKINEKVFEKVNKEQHKYFNVTKKINDIQNNGVKQTDNYFKKVKENTGQIINFGTELQYASMSGRNTFQKLSNVAGVLAKNLNTISFSAIGIFGIALGSATMVVSTFIDAFTDTSKVYLGLNESGVRLTTGLSGLRNAATNSLLSLDDFGNIVRKNSALVNSFGKNGLMAFSNILRASEEYGIQFGYSIEESAEHTAEYLDMLRRQGILARMSEPEMLRRNKDYLKNLDQFSKILGKSRDQIAAEMKAVLTRPDINAIFSGMPRDIADIARMSLENMTGVVSGAFGESGEEFSQELTNIAASMSPFSNELAQFIGQLSSGGKGFQDYILMLEGLKGRSGKVPTPEEMDAATRNFISGLKNLDQQSRDYISLAAQNSVHPFRQQALFLQKALQDSNSAILDANEQINNEAKEFSKFYFNMRKIGAAFATIGNKMFEILVPRFNKFVQYINDNLESKIIPAVESMARIFIKALEFIGGFVTYLENKNLMKEFTAAIIIGLPAMILGGMALAAKSAVTLLVVGIVTIVKSALEDIAKFIAHNTIIPLVDWFKNIPVIGNFFSGNTGNTSNQATSTNMHMAARVGFIPDTVVKTPVSETSKRNSEKMMNVQLQNMAVAKDKDDELNKQFIKQTQQLEKLNMLIEENNEHQKMMIDLGNTSNKNQKNISRNISLNSGIIR